MSQQQKLTYKVGRKKKQKNSHKGVLLVAGTLIFIVALVISTAWTTGYISKIAHHLQVSKQQQVTPIPKTATKPTIISHLVPTKSPIANAAPQSTHDYTFPSIQNGLAPVISRIATKEKVVFLTIDDGIVTNPNDAQLMQADRVKATFFLVHRFISSDWKYFANLAQETGSDVQNHSYDHYQLPGMSYDYQKWDICTNADVFKQWFGKRPILFRPSGGGYDATTQKAAADCGMKAIILWDATVNNGAVQYQHGSLQPGDIVLMHFRTTFSEDLNAFTKAAQVAGLQPELLSDWAPQSN